MKPLIPLAACLSVLSAPAAAQQRFPLWDRGVPGFEARATIPEQAQDYWTRQVNNPSVTFYAPDPARASGTAVLIVPGGGHRLLVTTSEGEAIGKWLAARGVAAFVLRYRLFREEGSPYTLDDARADTERGIRFIRAQAGRFGLDPHRVGIWGFSAGGELARMTTLSPPVPARGTGDAIDRGSARPDFSILIYPGPLHAEERVAKDAPPLFLAAANDDECCSQPTIDMFQLYRAAGASAELHIYRAGGHGYNLGVRSPLVALQHAQHQIEDWLQDQGLLGRPAEHRDRGPTPK